MCAPRAPGPPSKGLIPTYLHTDDRLHRNAGLSGKLASAPSDEASVQSRIVGYCLDPLVDNTFLSVGPSAAQPDLTPPRLSAFGPRRTSGGENGLRRAVASRDGVQLVHSPLCGSVVMAIITIGDAGVDPSPSLETVSLGLGYTPCGMPGGQSCCDHDDGHPPQRVASSSSPVAVLSTSRMNLMSVMTARRWRGDLIAAKPLQQFLSTPGA